MTTLIVWCDGAARGNPGPAGAGSQLTTPDGDIVAEISQGLGETTNHVADMAGVAIGSVYEYFPDKETIVAEVIRRLLRDTTREPASVTASEVRM